MAAVKHFPWRIPFLKIPQVKDTLTNCGLLRRLAAMCYDAILLFAVLFLATALVLPLTRGHAIHSGNLPYDLYLLLCSYLYFAWQWTHGGQTLGMRAWRIRLVDAGGGGVSWRTATLRFCLALLSLAALGFGFLWARFDPRGLAFHDRYSRTRLLVAAG